MPLKNSTNETSEKKNGENRFMTSLFVCFRGVVLDFWGYSICFLHTQMSSMEEQQEQTKRSIHSVIREISITLDLEVA